MCIPHGFVFTFYSLFVDYWLFLSSLDFFLLFSFLLKLILLLLLLLLYKYKFH